MLLKSKVEPRPGDPHITPALIAEHGLTADEYQRLVDMLGREPTFTELGIVSALWSEHCSYKHSRPLLKTLPTKAPKEVFRNCRRETSCVMRASS